MIITCACGDKRFEVDATLIPAEGRLLQCGHCDRKWHFKKELIKEKIDQDPIFFENNKSNEISHDNKENLDNKVLTNKTNNITEAEKIINGNKNSISLSLILRLLLVSIISFVGLVILLDTFKSTLTNIFPELEIVLQSLNETLKDIFLFFKDLVI